MRFLRLLSSSNIPAGFLRLQRPEPSQATRPLPAGIKDLGCLGLGMPPQNPQDVLHLIPMFNAVVAANQPKIVHAGPIQTCGLITAKSGHHPFLLMSWGYDLLQDAEKSADWKNAAIEALRCADALFVDCQTALACARRYTDCSNKKILCIPWGIEKDRFFPPKQTAAIRKRLGGLDKSIVLSTRMGKPVYRARLVLEAYRSAWLQNPELRLIMLGESEEAPALLQAIRAFGLESCVCLPGTVNNSKMHAWYQAADIYVSASVVDGASVSLLEAMASGLMVIATDIHSNAELIQHRHNGWLARAECPDHFAECIVEACNTSSTDKRRMRRINQDIVATRADWTQNSKKVIALYNELSATAS
jgi:glycosyltransferase involved in cell wall biosynthesis